MKKIAIASLSAVAMSLGAFAVADGHISTEQIESAVKARQAHMQLYSFHIATLGDMAAEKIPYNSIAAMTAANSMVALSQIDQSGYWLPGSDSASIEGTRALPAIWEEGSEARQKGADFAAAALAIQAAAGTDLDALKAGMSVLGATCGGCHRPYRQSNN